MKYGFVHKEMVRRYPDGSVYQVMFSDLRCASSGCNVFHEKSDGSSVSVICNSCGNLIGQLNDEACREALREGIFDEAAPNQVQDISLRDYIAGAEVYDGKPCPPELVDAALDYILNGHNDLLERLDGIVAEAVMHVTKSRCPYSVDGNCVLCPEDNPCRGTQAEQRECTARPKRRMTEPMEAALHGA